MGPRSRGGGQGGMPPRQRGRGGGPRGFSNRGEFGERGERTERPVGESGGLGQIDTWNPIGQEQQDQRQRHHKLQNKDAFDNAGNWGDDFPTAEDWDNDEYTGSLSDTKVFTPSGSSAKAVGEPVNGSVSHPAVGSGAALGSASQQQFGLLLQPAYRPVIPAQARRAGCSQCSSRWSNWTQPVQPDSHAGSQVSHRYRCEGWGAACSWIWEQQSQLQLWYCSPTFSLHKSGLPPARLIQLLSTRLSI